MPFGTATYYYLDMPLFVDMNRYTPNGVSYKRHD